jgi:hypothetical protein
MSDDLYEHDILAWSTRQADLLRRLARGERVNGIDWDHVAEEIEDVGLSELNAVCSYLRQIDGAFAEDCPVARQPGGRTPAR